MKWSEEQLAAAFQRRPHGRPASECLTLDEIERLALSTVSADQRQRLADHLVGCGRCAQLVQELRSLSGWAAQAAALRPRFPYARALAVAALIVLAVGFLFLAYPGNRHPPDDSDVRGATGTVVPPRGARLSDSPRLFNWPDQAGAVGYRLRIFDAGAELLWSSGQLDQSTCRLPVEIARRLSAGRSYSWTVEVEGSVQRGELGPFDFLLTERR